MTVRSIQITRKDARLVGAKYACLTATNRAAISCPDVKRLTVVNLANAAAVVGSLAIARTPGAVAYLSAKLWTITTDGYVIGYTNADTPAQSVISSPLFSDRSSWLTTCGSVVVAPGRVGSVVTINPATGAILAILDGALSRVELAVGNSGYLYCFDGHGLGAVISVDTTTGIMAKKNVFIAQDCQGALRGHIHNGQLVVVVDQLETVEVFDLDDAEAPSRASRTEYQGAHLNSAMDNDDRTALTDEERTDPGLSPFYPIVHGLVAASLADLYLHGPTGRITYTTDTAAIDILATLPGGSHAIGANTTITVKLLAQPNVNQTVAFSSIGNLTVVSGGTLTFTNGTWNTTQNLVVSASSDGLFEIPYTVTDANGSYRTGHVEIHIQDTATKNIDYVVPAGTHYVSLQYPIAITLHAQPGSGNTHTVIFTPDADLTIISGGTLTFTSDNWNVPQYVVISSATPAISTVAAPNEINVLSYAVTSLTGSPVAGTIPITFSGVVCPECPVIPPWDSSFFEVFNLQVQQPIIALATV